MTSSFDPSALNNESLQDDAEFYLFEASFAQQRMWFLDELLPGNPLYNLPFTVRLCGQLDPQALERSLQEIVLRHESLRTRFLMEDGELMQAILPDLVIAMPVVDVESLAEEQRETRAMELATEEAVYSFDLAKGPLIRSLLVRLSALDHLLVINMHHIISDGWSIGVFVRELAQLYRAFSSGAEPDLPELALQYADFAEWQREWLQGDVLDKQLAYWRTQLGGSLPVLQLPSDRLRPAVLTNRGTYQTFTLPKWLSESLKELSQRENATLYMTLLAAFKTLLYRYTGQTDLIVGSPIAGRNQGEIESLIGFFVNTLVLRTDLAGATFAELLQRVRQTTLDAYDHQDVPFEMLVGELKPERSMSYTPLFQVMFVLQNTPLTEFELQDLSMTLMETDSQTAKFDITLSMAEGAEGLTGRLEYNTDLFDGETIARMIQHFQTLLTGIVREPQQELSRLPLLNAEERLQMLGALAQPPSDVAGAEADLFAEKNICQVFEEQAARTPDAVAVVYEAEQLTYRELNERANRLAHYLQRQGVGPERFVGLWMERSLEMIVAILGVLKAGGAYVPLDPAYPSERIAFILEDAKVSVLITQESLRGNVPPHQAQTICLDSEWAQVQDECADNPAAQVTGETLAYVIYTSGSTGKPKGVLIPHVNVLRLFSQTQAWYGFDEQDVWTMYHSYAFDFSVWEIWGALLYGGKLVVVPYWVSRSPEAFYELLQQEKVTVLNQTPSAFRQLMAAEERVGMAPNLALRYVIFGGEALELQSLTPWFARHGDEQPLLVNMYGITETTVHVTYRPIRQQDVQQGLGSVIGVPIPDLQVYVLDEHLQPMPIGIPGEMYVGGRGLARGYLNRAELTAERFLTDPFSDDPGARLYKSGDIARYLVNGELEYQGRIDHQVKVRGFRIELGEIESALVAYPELREAVVIVREDTPGDKRLVAYLVAQLGVEPSIAALRTHLKESLPEYMIPSAFVVLDELPLTTNGKVDQRALPQPSHSREERVTEYAAPRTPEESTLAAIWAEVLHVEQLGIDDKFFESGGDSILSIQVLAQARKQGLDFTLQDLFRYQSIRELAPFVKRGGESGSEMTLSAPFSLLSEEDRLRLPEDAVDAYPLSKLQLGMLFHSQFNPDSVMYHNVSSHHLRAPFDKQAMEATLEHLMEKHPALRTSYHITGYSEPLQVVHRSIKFPLEVHDLRGMSASEQEAALAEWMEHEKHHAFQWEEAPLLRIHIHVRSEDTFQFGFVEHHVVLDGWSVALMMTEFFQTYLSLAKHQTKPTVEPASATFRDFVALERQALASEEDVRFWNELLDEYTFTKLPRQHKERPRTAEATHTQTGSLHIEISPEVSQGLKRLAESVQAPIRSALLAAHLRVISVASGQADVVTGVISNGRPEVPGGDKVLGLFLNTLPMRLRMEGGTWADLVRSTFAREQEVLPHRRYPLIEIQQQRGGQSLFETSFNYTHFHVFQTVMGGEIEVLEESGYGITNFAFAVDFSLDLTTSNVLLKILWDADQFGEEQIATIAQQYVKTLEQMAHHPQQRYETHCLLTTEQMQQLAGWNETDRDYVQEGTIHQRIEAQVERTPDEVALVVGEIRLTYAELNARANQLAHRLRELGVGPEVLVGVCMARSVEMVVSMLAVLKAGGAYVPLDPNYPQERIAFTLEDADAALLLTQTRLADTLPVPKERLLCLDGEGGTLAQLPTENPAAGTVASNLAYVIYTSGSTGRPKGVAIEHLSAINFMQWAEEVFTPEEMAGVLFSTSVCFDLSIFELFVTLSVGGKVILAENALHLPQLPAVHEVTLINTVPSAIAELLRSEGIPASVRTVNLAGEPLKNSIVQALYRIETISRVYNLYGPSEDTTYSTYALMEKGTDEEPKIGRPLTRTQVYLLDSHLQLVPPGVPGELHIGGDGLARGYLNRPELTAEKFIPNPFSSANGSRMYRTGDLARYLPDGTLDYLGRIDQQVKIRGFRIELGEIESVLLQHPAVREAAVLAVEHAPGDARLVGYLAMTERNETTEPGDDTLAELRATLAKQVPEHMVPSYFILLDELPLTPNGKIDRRALLQADGVRLTAEREYTAPRTPAEEVVTGVISDVLRLPKVGVHDNFFELGGHSLLATQVTSRLSQAFATELPLRLLFESPTAAGIAAYLEQAERREQAPPLSVVSRDGHLPLSFAQERLWFFEQLEPGTATYNIPGALRLTGSLNHSALEQSLNEIVRRHEALRTQFVTVEGKPQQIITADLALPLPTLDLSHVTEQERSSQVLRLAREEAMRPFDIAHDPLVRSILLKVEEEEHVLLLTMHHIVSDGWSIGVFLQELAALYAVFSQGQASTLPELPLQYADFAYWQRGWLQEEVLAEQVEYWKKQLGGTLPILQLPTDRPRPAVQTLRGSSQSLVIPRSIAEPLHELSQREGVTLFMTLLGAFNTLLSRYSGQEDIVVGSPIANRTHAETEALIGFFVNTLVLRTDLSGDPTFRDLLSRVREVALGAYAHQDVPFEKLVEELQPERDLSYTPLFQVMFVLQNAPMQALELPQLTVAPLEVELETAKFDLSLSMIEVEEGFHAHLEYNTDLFDSGTMERMLLHFQTLLEAISAAPDQQISKLPLLTAEQRRLLVEEWSANETPLTTETSIHRLFEAQVALTPDRVALLGASGSITYRELNERANALAHYLLELSVQAQEPVVLFMESSPEMIVSLLAILKAGGAYVPLDPENPADRLEYQLSDTQARVVLTQERLIAKLPNHQATVVAVDAQWESISTRCQDNLPVEVALDHLAYIIYTSGSTGRPKGVCVPHRGVLRLAKGATDYIELTPDDVFWQFATISFDAATFEIWGSLLNGAQLLVLPREKTSLAELGHTIRRYGVTTMILTTGLFHQMVESHLDDLRGVRNLLAGGDVLSVALAKKALQQIDGRLVNGYGPTESTTFTCCYEMTDVAQLESTVPIGRPIPGTEVYVLDRHLEPVPIGVPGELYIGGDGLALGYLNRPDVTAEAFVPHPFSAEPGARVYKSGDQVRFLADGRIEFLGRLDHQVKIRGFRIELGEIETVLGAHPQIVDVTVLAREDVPGDKRLVAYVVLDELADAERVQSELRGYLQAKLPAYMVPAFFVVMTTLPLTSNGKVDRRALPQPDRVHAEQGAAYAPPQTPTEEQLVAIWKDLLQFEQIGIHDSFFEIGGHSLLATQLISRVRQNFQLELPLRRLFEAPTIHRLAQEIEQVATSSAAQSADIQPVDRNQPLPLSFAQERLWFLEQLEGGTGTYNIPSVLRLHGELDTYALERSFVEIIARHEALRTRFLAVEGQPIQVIDTEVNFALPLLDLQELADVSWEAECMRIALAEAEQPFDLKKGPLLRALLLKRSDQEHVLLFTMHHIIADGWSLGIFLQELVELYGAFCLEQPSPLAALPVQYADFAHWQREWLQGDVLEEQLSYWKKTLGGTLPILQLPTDRPRPAVQTLQGSSLSKRLPQSLSAALQSLSQQQDVTLFMLLLSAFKTLLYRYTGQEDILVGTPIAGRTQAEIEPLIGFFVNTLVLRTDVAGDQSFVDLLQRMREVALGAYGHQDVPFEKLVEVLKPERDLSHTPLFQVMFSLQNAPLQQIELPGLQMQPLELASQTAKFDLNMTMVESEAGMLVVVEYNTDLFDASTISRFLDHFHTLLESILVNPEHQLSQLPLLRGEEREQLLFAWNQTEREYDQALCLHQLFEAQVLRTPQETALVVGEERLTYHELNTRANQVAHQLQALGVGPEVLVGVLMERSVEMVVGMLGILKAGGAYVPLDPNYPQDRIAYTLEDAQAPLLLTQQRLVEALGEQSAQVLCLDSEWEAIAEFSGENLSVGVAARNLAYVIYTSGSTGRPKGVAIEHFNAVTFAHWAHEVFAPEELAGVLFSTSICFDLSVFELFVTLGSGGKVILAENALQLPNLPAKQEVTLINTVPSAATELLRMQGIPSSVQTINLAGEPLKNALVQALYGIDNIEKVYNLYGPSEDTTYSTYTLTEKGAIAEPRIGRPIARTQVYMLDQHLQPVPVGVPGELHIGGDGLARGYLNRAELTAEKFIVNPFANDPHARLYKTGDLARYLPDGTIEYLGRLDHQVKIRGFRIELGEIEVRLAQHPAVREAVVLAREDNASDTRLVAYLVTGEASAPDLHDLRAHLKQKLPDYMVPSHFVTLEAMPLTPNGKLDRKALPAPQAAVIDREAVYLAPRDSFEMELTQIFEELLTIRPVGVKDNFFALGGHSLLAVRLMAQIEQQFAQALPLSTLFQNGSVEHLAAHLREGVQGSGPRSTVVQIRGGSKRPFFCVHPVGGNVLSYYELASALDPDQPFYGLESLGLADDRAPLETVEEMAAHYIADIRALQPEGPYLLGGWSFGGAVALEMAQQLQQQGQVVERVMLFDSVAPIAEHKDEELSESAILEQFVLEATFRFGFEAEGLQEKIDACDTEAVLQGLFDQARAHGTLPVGMELFHLRRLCRVYTANRQADHLYLAKPYQGRLDLFKAIDQVTPYSAHPSIGWAEVGIQQLVVHEVSGDHNSMLQAPHVQAVAAILTEHFAKFLPGTRIYR